MGRRWLILTLIFLGVTASMAASFAPFIVGALVEFGGLSVREAGMVAAGEMAGAMVGAFAVFHIVNKIERRTLMWAGMLLFAIGNMVSMSVDGFASIVAVRAACGFVSAIVVATVAATMAIQPSSERAYGWFFFTMIVSSAVGALVMPAIVAMGGAKAVFVGIAIISLMAFTAALSLPPFKSAVIERSASAARAPILRRALALMSMLLLFTAFGAAWTFVERIGAALSMTPQQIGVALSLSMAGGALGSLAATFAGARFGLFLPIIVAACASTFGAWSMTFGLSLASFTIAVLVFKFGFSLGVPYLSAIFASIDPSGRLMTLGTLTQAAGLALGPGLGALFVHGADVSSAVLFSVLVSAVYGLLSGLLARNADKRASVGDTRMKPMEATRV